MSNDDDFSKAQAHLDARRWLEARALLTPLAEAGDVRSQELMSRLEETGSGGPRDLAASLRWCAAAAAQGSLAAIRKLGIKHRLGHGTPANLDEAQAWLRQGTDRGDLDALCELADLLRTRPNGKRDPAEAARLYRVGAEGGAVMAQWALGKMLAEGEGVERDLVEAWLWFQRAVARSPQPIAWERDRVAALETLMTEEQLRAARERLR